MKKDTIAKNQVLFQRIDLAAVGTPVLGTAIDTQGVKGITVAMQPLDKSDTYKVIALTDTNDIDVTFHECDTSGGTYAAIDTAKYLPTGDGRKLEILPANGIFKIGCFGTKRYIKPVINVVTIDGITASNLLVSVIAVKEMDAVPIL